MTIQVVSGLLLTRKQKLCFSTWAHTKAELSHKCQREVWNKVLGHPVECCVKINTEIGDRRSKLQEGERKVSLNQIQGVQSPGEPGLG